MSYKIIKFSEGSMICIPEDYQGLDLTLEVKRLLNILNSYLDDSYYALLNVIPLGTGVIDLVLVNAEQGVLCITYDGYEHREQLGLYLNAVNRLWEDEKKQLIGKFMKHGMLRVGDKLKFNCNWVRFIPKVSDFDGDEIICHDFFQEVQQGNTSRLNALFGEEKSQLTDAEVNLLIFYIAPEYTIPKKFGGLANEYYDVEYKPNGEKLGNNDDMVKSLLLDHSQVQLVNDIKIGDHLILACAGSGKSAVLIANAFKQASTHPDKEILITCFNRNLAQEYEWQVDVAGLRERNVRCMSFFSLCKYLLDSNGIHYTREHNDDMNFQKLFTTANEALHSGRIKQRFYGIFVDEVQIFKREWYMFCYNLLANKNPERHVFVICGDKSQNVNNNIKKGEAPWQVREEGFPDYSLDSRRVEQNYRNSKQINSYVNSFVSSAKEYFEQFSIPVASDHDLFLRGTSFRNGATPVIVQASRTNEKDEVIRAIKELNEKKNIPLSEIAVVMANKSYRPRKYFIMDWLTAQLSEHAIPYSIIVAMQDDWVVRFADRKGVVLTTIESALGLDFEAVILCGLFPLGQYHKVTTVKLLMNVNEDENVKKEEFFKAVNLLYTGMTRARNELYVVLSLPESNIYTKLLTEAAKEENIVFTECAKEA